MRPAQILVASASLALSWTAASGAVTAQSEMLGVSVPDDFQVGYHASNASIDMKEVVQPPETVDNWTKLVTLQLFYGLAKRESAGTYYARWRKSLQTACAGMTDTMVKGTVDGKPAIRGALSCPNNPQTGKPENLVAVLIQGDANLMMVQVAFRHPIGAGDKPLIDRVTRSLKVCDQRRLAECSARKPVGFVASAKR